MPRRSNSIYQKDVDDSDALMLATTFKFEEAINDRPIQICIVFFHLNIDLVQFITNENKSKEKKVLTTISFPFLTSQKRNGKKKAQQRKLRKSNRLNL
jgi:hypothetical protein